MLTKISLELPHIRDTRQLHVERNRLSAIFAVQKK
jgi:hypothetical protein